MAKIRSADLSNPFLPSLEGVCDLLLVRHGEQLHEKNQPIGEAHDAPLTELGRQQAAAVGQRLADTPIHAVYSSELQRANHTGIAVAEHHGLSVTKLAALNEIDLWRDAPQDQGLLDSIGADALVDIMRAANNSGRWDDYIHGESGDEFRARILPAIDDIVERHTGERVVVACHGGVITTVLAHLWQSSFDRVVMVHHTSITTVRAAGDLRRVLSVNDFQHVLPFQSDLNPLNRS